MEETLDITREQLLHELKQWFESWFPSYYEGFYESAVYETVQGTFRVIKTLTFGELLISTLLLTLILMYITHWIWEALR